jgi:hypothetical protein
MRTRSRKGTQSKGDSDALRSDQEHFNLQGIRCRATSNKLGMFPSDAPQSVARVSGECRDD